MIRSSDTAAHAPTRQVTAQRYQAAVSPTAPQVSGLEKLAEFGMGVAKVKHQIDEEVFQADLTMAADKYSTTIKAIDPAAFVKDPEGAMKSAGIDEMYALVSEAPIGMQRVLRKKIDVMAAGTKASMTAAHTTRETARAAVYNTSKELRDTGNVTQEHWDMVMTLDKDTQHNTVEAMAQIAITEGHLELFNRMASDSRLSPELHANVEVWKRQAEGIADAKTREQEAAKRRQAIEATKVHKEHLKTLSNQAVMEMLSKGTPLDVVLSLAPINSNVKRDEVEWAVRSNPALHRTVAASSVLNTDKYLMSSMFANPLSPDGKTPSSSFGTAAATLKMYLDVRGNVESLEGVGLTSNQRQAVQAAQTLTSRTGGYFSVNLYRALIATPHPMPVDYSAEKKRDVAVMKDLSRSQQIKYQQEKAALIRYGLPPEEAAVKATEYVKADAHDVGGITITGITGVRNILSETIGVHVEDTILDEVINTTIDKHLGAASVSYFGTNQDLSKWTQYGDNGGTVLFQHKEALGLLIAVTPDMFKKTAREFKQKDVTYGKPEDLRRVDHPDRYHTVGAGYPIRSY